MSNLKAYKHNQFAPCGAGRGYRRAAAEDRYQKKLTICATTKAAFRMTKPFELEISPLCQTITENGKTLSVEIYREAGKNWHLEVADELGNTTVWDDPFPADAAALEEAKSAIRDESVDAFIGTPT